MPEVQLSLQDFRIRRLNILFDEGWQEFDSTLHSTDPLNFTASKPYKETLAALPAKTGSWRP